MQSPWFLKARLARRAPALYAAVVAADLSLKAALTEMSEGPGPGAVAAPRVSEGEAVSPLQSPPHGDEPERSDVPELPETGSRVRSDREVGHMAISMSLTRDSGVTRA
jgi:hypothetical protein